VYWKREFKWIILLLFILLISVICIGVQQGMQIAIATAQQEEQTVSYRRQNVTTLQIFFNNWRIFLFSFIPIVGWIIGFNDWHNTGIIIGEEFETMNVASFANILTSNPYVYTEVLCFTLFIGESMYLIFLSVQDISKAKERLLKYSWMTLLSASILTFMSAWSEYLVIQGNFSGWLILLGILLVTVYFVAKAVTSTEE
jgi:sulfite exporter TauE/SafE